MSQHTSPPTTPVVTSPLILCDRLITLAQDADRAGCAATAERLVKLVDTMFRETSTQRRRAGWTAANSRNAIWGGASHTLKRVAS